MPSPSSSDVTMGTHAGREGKPTPDECPLQLWGAEDPKLEVSLMPESCLHRDVPSQT